MDLRGLGRGRARGRPPHAPALRDGALPRRRGHRARLGGPGLLQGAPVQVRHTGHHRRLPRGLPPPRRERPRPLRASGPLRRPQHGGSPPRSGLAQPRGKGTPGLRGAGARRAGLLVRGGHGQEPHVGARRLQPLRPGRPRPRKEPRRQGPHSRPAARGLPSAERGEPRAAAAPARGGPRPPGGVCQRALSTRPDRHGTARPARAVVGRARPRPRASTGWTSPLHCRLRTI
mmetsp:Transcript_1669/g.5453  ORF Transcript_1669/g.5453 Transcript_1669/m.5453 type:complete len:231 (-) Transcript_1669:272-964(-)